MLEVHRRNQNWFNEFGVIENENEYKIQIAAMGFTKNEASISLDGECLNISLRHNEDKDNYYFSMRNYKQSFIVPNDVNREMISATLENGILAVVLPKQEKSKVVRQISIC